MSDYSNKLSEMVNNTDDQISALDDSTAQLILQIEELEEQRDAIQYGLMDQIAFIDLSSYLVITKVPDKGGVGGYISFGVDYGVINVTDWIIYNVLNIPVYIYGGVGWDDDSIIIDFIDKWNFGYDYINHPFNLTGTYGLQSRIDQLNNGLNLLIQNKQKVEGTSSAFNGYNN